MPYSHLQISKALEVGQKTNTSLLFDPLQLKSTEVFGSVKHILGDIISIFSRKFSS